MSRVEKVLVRCLGLGKEHYFLSVDKVNNRVCKKCQQELDRRRLPPRCTAPIRDQRE